MFSKLGTGAVILALALVPGLGAKTQDVIKIGIPVGLSGANSVVAPSVVQSAELAAEEINAKGGIMGKKVELEVADDGSGAAGAQKAFDSLIFQKKVNALISMETSAARNAGLPIVSRGKTPFIYTSFYEGRSCNKYLFVNDGFPTRRSAPIVDYFMRRVQGENLLPDRQRLRLRTRHAAVHRGYIEKTGGKVLGEEYLPMDGSDWTAIISKLKAANPDALITSTAGGAPNVTLTKQLRAAGVKIPSAIWRWMKAPPRAWDRRRGHLHLGLLLHQHRTTPRTRISGRHAEEIRRRSEDSERSVGTAIRRRVSVQERGRESRRDRRRTVIAALSQVSFDGPRGMVQMNKQRHAPLTMYLGQVGKTAR